MIRLHPKVLVVSCILTHLLCLNPHQSNKTSNAPSKICALDARKRSTSPEMSPHILDREIMQEEEEVLTINVKPGWRKGTKIKFEGKGNDRLGEYGEGVIYCISEKRHELFKREGDDLELTLEIPLVKALTGSAISVPLLGGQRMDLTMDDQNCMPWLSEDRHRLRHANLT